MKNPSKNPAVEYMKNVKRVDQGSDKFVLRLPDGMRDFVAGMAERNGRSMNAEIINALAHQIARFNPGKSIPAGMIDAMNDAMAERIRQGEIQRTVREMGAKMEILAKELDGVVSDARAKSSDKKNPPA
jgi:hypothetical protein